MACTDSYEVWDAEGSCIGSTTYVGWEPCGMCSSCVWAERPYPTLSDDSLDVSAIKLATYLSDALSESRISNDIAYHVIDLFTL